MKIELLTRLAGPDGNYPAGSVIDVPDKDADALIEGRYAARKDEEDVRPKARSKPDNGRKR